MLLEVWSGGQDGADIAGLRASRAAGLKTGGWMPRGWRTASGSRPEYAALYGVSQHESHRYMHRTECNVRDTNATLILGDNQDSSGSRLTRWFCIRHGKVCAGVTTAEMATPESIERTVEWLRVHNVKRLNVAGNRDAPEEAIEGWLLQVFLACRNPV